MASASTHYSWRSMKSYGTPSAASTAAAAADRYHGTQAGAAYSRLASYEVAAAPQRVAAPSPRMAAAPPPTTGAFMTQVSRDQPTRSRTPTKAVPRPTTVARASAGGRQPLLPSHPLQGRMLLVLDMDETLLHASVTPTEHDVSFVVNMENGQSVPVYVKFRPGVDEFLAAVSRIFEVAVFTASISRYANQVLDYLDPSGRLFHHRLYRQHCTEIDGSYVKDLSRLGRPMDRLAIVDNSPTAYSMHPQNGIPIVSWFDCNRDRELMKMLPSLERMARERDVYGTCTDIQRRFR